MKKFLIILLFALASFAAKAQKIESIHFNLYTDSLKKGVHNYINVDGKLSSGSFYPLMASEVVFSSNAGRWEGNSIIIDSAYKNDSVVITASLKANPSVSKNVIIYIKRSSFEGIIKSEKELLEEWKTEIKNKGRKKN
ncbi:MAG TPA: hypothetical protein VF622_05780 [Segetibacter sp.]|jgi:hypothetical protein